MPYFLQIWGRCVSLAWPASVGQPPRLGGARPALDGGASGRQGRLHQPFSALGQRGPNHHAKPYLGKPIYAILCSALLYQNHITKLYLGTGKPIHAIPLCFARPYHEVCASRCVNAGGGGTGCC